MTAIVFLVLRILLCLCLYAFLFLMFITLRKDIKLQGKLLTSRKVPSLHLIRKGTDGLKDKLFFEKEEISIGRDLSCDYRFDDDTVSSFHARLKYHHNQWWLEDLGSMNGTFINECSVFTPTVVISGDVIRCGNNSIMLEVSGEGLLNSTEIHAKGDQGGNNG